MTVFMCPFMQVRSVDLTAVPERDGTKDPLQVNNVRSHVYPAMAPITGFFVIKPEGLFWRPSNLMKIPNADFLERTKSEILGARLWRFPPKSANTLHRHPKMEELYFVVEGVGRMRIAD